MQMNEVAGMDLREDCFSHGQFYVAYFSKFVQMIIPTERRTTNAVYKELLK